MNFPKYFKILLLKCKPTTLGTTYRPLNQLNFLEVLNDNMDKIYSYLDLTLIPYPLYYHIAI